MGVRTIQAGCLLGLLLLAGCASNPPTDSPPGLPCPVTPTPSPTISQDQSPLQTANSKNQAATIHALQKRLQEQEQTIAVRDHQIEVLSGKLEALKRIDQDTRHRKRLVPPAPAVTVPRP